MQAEKERAEERQEEDCGKRERREEAQEEQEEELQGFRTLYSGSEEKGLMER
jgi:hypothetical protein